MENSPAKKPGGEEKFYENYKKRYNHRIGAIRRLYEEKLSNIEYYEMVLEESGYYHELETTTWKASRGHETQYNTTTY